MEGARGRWWRGAMPLAVAVASVAAAGCEKTGQAETAPAAAATPGAPGAAGTPGPVGAAGTSGTSTVPAALAATQGATRQTAPAAEPSRPVPAPATAQPIAPARARALTIVFEPPVLDFGIVSPNVSPSGSVQIRNLGREPVHIKSMKPTCKCTAVEDLTGTEIPAGGSTTLTARLDSRSVAGVRNEAVRLVLAESDQVFELAVRAEVTLPVRASPSILNLASGQFTGHLVVESVAGTPFHILAANGQPPRYVGFDPDLDELASSYVLEWDLSGESAAGKLPRWFVVETDHPDCPLVDVWVRDRSTIEVPQANRRWRVSDMRVMLGLLPPGGSREFTVTIEELGSASLAAVRSLTPALDAKLVNVERQGASAQVRVLVTARPETRGMFLGRVEFMSSTGTQGLDVIGKVAP